jgi:hypothetical protein
LVSHSHNMHIAFSCMVTILLLYCRNAWWEPCYQLHDEKFLVLLYWLWKPIIRWKIYRHPVDYDVQYQCIVERNCTAINILDFVVSPSICSVKTLKCYSFIFSWCVKCLCLHPPRETFRS